ncbi:MULTISPECIES: hypothetical protein [Rhizobium]|uniref:hypothetical protein n=1 Tax=Rhizobium TaxID=379 RepID=UPI000462C577|nr:MULTISPECIES: hypothetical protein [Rhizobium]MCA0802965.1 hypothetical protein [Rhizobium sp. T1473]MCS0461464.1 hypothetical protein [Rhizobium favelukesii]UFS83475.1 hypothetical protein LPB79_14745 [Rhizobium sp. T136]
MRILVTTIAVLALSAVPCAWDTAPGEPPAIAALFSWLSPPTDAGSKQTAQTANVAFVATSADKALPQRANY